MNHSDDGMEAFFHGMYPDGKLDSEQMALISERLPGFRVPEAPEKTPLDDAVPSLPIRSV